MSVPTRIVTSLSTKNIERQTYCLTTWQRYGLPITAVQTTGESTLLQEKFPWVEYIETDLVGDKFGKSYLPRTIELVRQAKTETILIINSDISIEDTKEEFFTNWDIPGLGCGIRLNHRRYGSTRVKRNPFGIDAFKIEPEMADIKDLGFCIGMPGWDYWLPYELNRRGYPISVSQSHLLHLMHDLNYEDEYIKIGVDLLVKNYGYTRPHFTYVVQRLTGRRNMNHRNTKPINFNWREL